MDNASAAFVELPAEILKQIEQIAPPGLAQGATLI